MRDMVGLSSLRTPLAHRNGAAVESALSAGLASYKCSLLHPHGTHTLGDEDDDGIDHEGQCSVLTVGSYVHKDNPRHTTQKTRSPVLTQGSKQLLEKWLKVSPF